MSNSVSSKTVFWGGLADDLSPSRLDLVVLGLPPCRTGGGARFAPPREAERCSFDTMSARGALGHDEELVRSLAQCVFDLPIDDQRRSDLMWVFSMWPQYEWIHPVVDVALDNGPSALKAVDTLCMANRRTLPTGLTCPSAIRERASIIGRDAYESGDLARCVRVYSLLLTEYPHEMLMPTPYYLYQRIECLHAAGNDDLAATSLTRLRTEFHDSPYRVKAETLLGVTDTSFPDTFPSPSTGPQ